MEQSKRFSLNQLDRKKIARGALIAIAGLLFTYFEGEVFPLIDWGTYAPLAVAVNSVIVNVVSKRLAGQKAL